MSRALRIILAFSLLVQSLCSMQVKACAAVNREDGVKPSRMMCCCCKSGMEDSSSSGCRFDNNQPESCCCKVGPSRSTPSVPDTPAPGSGGRENRGDSVDRIFAAAPILILLVQPASLPAIATSQLLGSVILCSGQSIQSIFCIWVT
jgi:hypothetical protein